MEGRITTDQGAVEVTREGGDGGREAVGEVQPPDA